MDFKWSKDEAQNVWMNNPLFWEISASYKLDFYMQTVPFMAYIYTKTNKLKRCCVVAVLEPAV